MLWLKGRYRCQYVTSVQKLIAHFGSPKKVKNARASEISEATNLNVAKKIFDYYRQQEVTKPEE